MKPEKNLQLDTNFLLHLVNLKIYKVKTQKLYLSKKKSILRVNRFLIHPKELPNKPECQFII